MLVAMARGTHSSTRQPRIHPLVPALVAVVVTGALILVVANLGDDEPAAAPPDTTTSASTTITFPDIPTTTTTLPPPVPLGPLLTPAPSVDAPVAYRLTYDIVENGLPRVEEWMVDRPYESLVVSTRDGVLLSGTSTSRARLQTFLSREDGWLPIQPQLHRAAFDQRPAAALAAMEVLGLVERRGEDEHLGRSCTVYRTGQPPSAGAPTAPTEGEFTDVCIDAAGIVLHERWEIGGTTVVEKTATALELGAEIDPAVFEPGPVVEDAEALSAAFATIAVEADEETLDRLETEVPLPPGYVDDGAVFRAADGGGRSGAGSAEIVRFYSSGPDLLEVAEVFVDGPAGLGEDAAVLVEVEGWDEVWFEPGFRTSFLRARLGDSSYVELRHQDVPFLFEVLGSLTRR